MHLVGLKKYYSILKHVNDVKRILKSRNEGILWNIASQLENEESQKSFLESSENNYLYKLHFSKIEYIFKSLKCMQEVFRKNHN